MKREIAAHFGEPYARLAVLLNEARGWAKATLPTYQERKEFFEGIVERRPRPDRAAARRLRRRRRPAAGAPARRPPCAS